MNSVILVLMMQMITGMNHFDIRGVGKLAGAAEQPLGVGLVKIHTDDHVLECTHDFSSFDRTVQPTRRLHSIIVQRQTPANLIANIEGDSSFLQARKLIHHLSIGPQLPFDGYAAGSQARREL